MKILPLLAALTTAQAAFAAEPVSLDRLSAYLDDLRTAEAPFTQINADGSLSTGTITLHRPGRARFEYNPPDAALVIVGGSAVAIFDMKTKQAPEQYPLRRTPLWVILGPEVDLASSDAVVGTEADDLTTTVIARDPENPEAGQLRLVFTSDPLELRQWVVIDEGGAETTVILGALNRDVSPRAALFDIDRTARDLLGGSER